MKVIATAIGYDGTTVRQVDEEFEMPEGAKGSWFTSLESAQKVAKAKSTKAAKADAKPEGEGGDIA
jgi:hypothetical protein